LLTEATASVHEEHLHLAALAAEAGLDPKQGIVRLRKGPRPTDQEVEDRIDLSVTSSCDACASFHRTDHSCSSCEDRTWQAACQVRPTSTPLAKLSPEQRIERALRAGKSARWIADNLAEPIQLILRVLDRLRSENWS
jgi:hypothetical protein